MKLLIFLILTPIFIYSFNTKSYYQSDFKNGYYPIESFNFDILSMEDDELLFYGNQGVILKTTDGGQNWQQNFSGTYGNIIKMLYNNNIIFGISSHNEFIISSDKGDYWEVTEFNTELSNIIYNDEIIYISVFDSDTIYISSDYGNSFETMKLNLTNINSIYKFNDKMIFQNIVGELYISQSNLNDLVELTLPNITDFKISNIDNNFYIYDKRNIFQLKDDLTWLEIPINTDERDFLFYPKEDGLFILNEFKDFNSSTENENYYLSEITINGDNIESHNIIDSLFAVSFNGYSTYKGDNESNKFHFIAMNNGNIYLSNYYGKMLKYNKSNSFELINEKLPVTNFNSNYIFSENLWFKINDNTTNILKSTDGGASFKRISPIYEEDTENSIDYYYFPFLYDNYLADENNFFLTLKNYYNLDDNTITEESKVNSWAVTYDGGENYTILRDSISKHLFVNNENEQTFMSPQGLIDGKFLLSQQYNDTVYFYLLDDKNSLNQVSLMDSVEIAVCFKDNFNNLTWCKTIFRFDIIEDDSTIRKELVKYYYTEDGSTWVNIFSEALDRNSNSEIGLVDDEIHLIINRDKPYLYKVDINTNTLDEIEIDSRYKTLRYDINRYKFNIYNFEHNAMYGIWEEEVNDRKFNRTDMVKLNIDGNSTNVNLMIEKFEAQNVLVHKDFFTEDTYYYKFISGAGSFIFKKMDTQRHLYYLSVNQKDINKELLNLSIYPNPVQNSNLINIEFEAISDFLEIYDILGNKVKTLNYKSNDYKVNIEEYKSGVYIATGKVGNILVSQKFIVE